MKKRLAEDYVIRILRKTEALGAQIRDPRRNTRSVGTAKGTSLLIGSEL
jgi:hypothetical protein